MAEIFKFIYGKITGSIVIENILSEKEVENFKNDYASLIASLRERKPTFSSKKIESWDHHSGKFGVMIENDDTLAATFFVMKTDSSAIKIKCLISEIYNDVNTVYLDQIKVIDYEVMQE